MKSTTVFWDVMPCSLVKFVDSLEEYTASILRVKVMSKKQVESRALLA
jgi:hypothetical protein